MDYPCSPSLLLLLSCWLSVSWWQSTLGQDYTRAMPLSPQSHQPQSWKAASTSSAGECWAPRTLMETPGRNLLSLAPTLCQMGLGSALMKSHVCRRDTVKSWTDLAHNKKPDRELGQKQLGVWTSELWKCTHGLSWSCSLGRIFIEKVLMRTGGIKEASGICLETCSCEHYQGP
ncbi:unnamed protein product, partial [Gulo gulo]